MVHRARVPGFDPSIVKRLILTKTHPVRAAALALRTMSGVAFCSVLVIAPCVLVHALEPNQVLVLVNLNVAGSVEVAKAYMGKRAIPDGNLLTLRLTDKETCSRHEYNRNVALPVRKYLRDEDPARRIRCLVTIYGMPLKVSPPEMDDSERGHSTSSGPRKGHL